MKRIITPVIGIRSFGLFQGATRRKGVREALNSETREVIMDALAEELDARLREWKPGKVAEARESITEVIELADHDVLRKTGQPLRATRKV